MEGCQQRFWVETFQIETIASTLALERKHEKTTNHAAGGQGKERMGDGLTDGRAQPGKALKATARRADLILSAEASVQGRVA